jgi:hypothetical protein
MDGTFTDVAVMSGCAYSDNGHEQAGMGVAVADYDCDGWFDIFKTNFVDDTVNLYHNNGDGTYSDVSSTSGVGINNRYVAWGCGFIDYDNDGWTDIVQVNGHVYPEVDLYKTFLPEWEQGSANASPVVARHSETITTTATWTSWS